jgi:glycosyltransferase involved in cell wall biosynthesis
LSERRRVLLVTSGLDATGGISRYTRWLIDALADDTEVRVTDLGLDPTGGGVVGRLLALARGWRSWWRSRPDVVVLAHLSLGAVAIGQRLLGRPVVSIAYGMEVWGPRKPSIDVTALLATEIWPISSFTAHEVRARWARATVGPVLGAGIEEEFFVDHQPHDGPARLLAVARLQDLAGKGLDTCIEAVVLVANEVDVELRIVGSGRAADELEALIASRGATDCVHMLGSIDDDALRREYQTAALLLLVSRFGRGSSPQGEGLGIVTLEAAAAGTPAIVTEVGGTVDTVVEAQTGLLIPPGDPEALAAAISDLVRDEGRRRALGSEARRFTRANHSELAFRRRVRRALASVR